MRLLFFLLLFPTLLLSQSNYLTDPDIVWAAEIEQDWVLDVPSLETEWDSGLTTIKLLRTEENKPYWNNPFLAELIYQAVAQGRLPVFTDPLCRVPLRWENVYPRLDTVVTFDPETYEEKLAVVKQDPDPYHDFRAWRLRQVLCYHKKSATWSTRVEAIAPLLILRSAQGDSVGLRPLFWFKPEDKRPKLRSNDIVWAKSTKTRQLKTLVPIDPVKPVKINDGYRNPVPHLIQEIANNPKTPVYDSWEQRPLRPEERSRILSRTDTIVTFDPETYEEKVKVVHNELDLSHIHQLRLYQTWYWDERRRRLSICLDWVAPMFDVHDVNGNFRYSMPLFLRKAK